VAAAADRVLELLGAHVWAEGETSWAEAIGRELGARRERLAVVEIGTGGSLATLLGDVAWVALAVAAAPNAPAATAHGARGLEELARATMAQGGAGIGLAIRARPRGDDTAVSVVVVQPGAVDRERRIAFLGGSNGRTRAALAAAHILLTALRGRAPAGDR
jgi:hypothetical protein